MYSSGQWFFTAIWEKYHALISFDKSVQEDSGKWTPLYHILTDMRPGADDWVFFTQVDGESWADWDYQMVKFVGDHIAWLILLIAVFVSVLVWTYLRCRARMLRTTMGYKQLDTHGSSGAA